MLGRWCGGVWDAWGSSTQPPDKPPSTKDPPATHLAPRPGAVHVERKGEMVGGGGGRGVLRPSTPRGTARTARLEPWTTLDPHLGGPGGALDGHGWPWSAKVGGDHWPPHGAHSTPRVPPHLPPPLDGLGQPLGGLASPPCPCTKHDACRQPPHTHQSGCQNWVGAWGHALWGDHADPNLIFARLTTPQFYASSGSHGLAGTEVEEGGEGQ